MGGTTTIQQPSAPVAPSVTSSIQDYVQNYPALFALQQQYAPQEAAQQVQLAQQYAEPLGQAYKTAQEAMYPGETGITNALNQQVQEGMGSNVPDWQRQEYLSNLNANMGTNIGSPIGADYASLGLLQQKQDWQNYYRNLGLSITGRQPVYSATTPATSGSVTSQYSPQGVMNYNASTYSPYASAYSSMYGTNANYSTQNNPLNKMNFGWSSKNGLSLGYGG